LKTTDIQYSIERKTRRKTLSLVISSDNRIVVKANKTLPEREIKNFVSSKRKWIVKTLHFNAQVRVPFIAKNFSNGDRFLFLGKEYDLVIRDNFFNSFPERS